MTDDVATGAPDQQQLVLGEVIAGAVDLRPVLHLESDMVQLGHRIIHQIDGVMIRVAAQEAEEVAANVREAEAQHLLIEFHHGENVDAAIGDMAELEGHDAIGLAIVGRKFIFGIDVDVRALVVFEGDGVANPGADLAASGGAHAMFGQFLDAIVEIGARRHLKGEARQARLFALDQRDGLKPNLGGEDGAVLVAGDHVEADDLVVIFDGAIKVGGGERCVADAANLYHGCSLGWGAHRPRR